MAPYNAANLLYKYFGISFFDFEYYLPVSKYFPLWAKALDLDELEEYRFFIAHNQDRKKKFQWSSPDQAGTKPIDGPANKHRMPMASFVGDKGLKPSKNSLARAKEIALAQGRQIIYIHPDRTLRDDLNGNILGKYQQISKFINEGYVPYPVRPSDLQAVTA